MKVEDVSRPRRDDVLALSDRTPARRVDRLAVAREPRTDLLQHLDRARRKLSRPVRTDVHEEIRVLRRRPRNHGDDLGRRAKVPLANPIAPHAVLDDVALFDRPIIRDRLVLGEARAGIVARKVTLEELDVLLLANRLVVVVRDQHVLRMDEVVNLVELPVQRPLPAAVFLMVRVLPFAVEPDIARTISFDEFVDLSEHELQVRGVIALLVAEHGLRDVPGRIVLPMPVHERIVEVELQALLVAGALELSEDVAPERRLRDVVAVIDLRRPEREAVMVARRDRHVLRARRAEELRPLRRVVLRRIEPVHHPLVRLAFERFPAVVVVSRLQIPLALRVVRVESPVDENAEPLVGELLPRLLVPRLGLTKGKQPHRHGRHSCKCNRLHVSPYLWWPNRSQR